MNKKTRGDVWKELTDTQMANAELGTLIVELQEKILGSKCSMAYANTWRTFTTCVVYADGSGYVTVKRDGTVIHEFSFPSENESTEKIV